MHTKANKKNEEKWQNEIICELFYGCGPNHNSINGERFSSSKYLLLFLTFQKTGLRNYLHKIMLDHYFQYKATTYQLFINHSYFNRKCPNSIISYKTNRPIAFYEPNLLFVKFSVAVNFHI